MSSASNSKNRSRKNCKTAKIWYDFCMLESLNFDEAAEENQKSPKEIIWEQKLKELDEVTDGVVLGLDKHIKEVVADFNVNGFNTGQSCEGHTEQGFGAPWIRTEAPDQPEERSVNERKIYEKVARKYAVPYEDVKRDINHKAWLEAVKLCDKQDETPEYMAWKGQGRRLREKIKKFADEFYKDRDVDFKTKIRIPKISATGKIFIHNGGRDYNPVENMKEKQKNGLEERLVKYREEMQAFGDFLKDKFFNS